MSKNEITGDEIATKAVNDLYRDGFDRIWGKPTDLLDQLARQTPSFRAGRMSKKKLKKREFPLLLLGSELEPTPAKNWYMPTRCGSAHRSN